MAARARGAFFVTHEAGLANRVPALDFGEHVTIGAP